MNKNPQTLFLIVALALAVVTGSASALAETTSQELTDVRQETQIWTSYALNPYLRAHDLSVSVGSGKATLTWHVAEVLNKELAN